VPVSGSWWSSRKTAARPRYLPGSCRSSSIRRVDILQLPDWETLPYDNFSPHQDIVSERLRSLHRLPRAQRGVLIVPMSALLQRLPPRPLHRGQQPVPVPGSAAGRRRPARGAHAQRLSQRADGLRAWRVRRARFAHGPVPDGFGPAPAHRPARRRDRLPALLRPGDTAHPAPRRQSIELLPAREFPLDRGGIRRFQQRWYARFDVDHDQCPLFTEISAGRAPGGAEYYLPLFFERCETAARLPSTHSGAGRHRRSPRRCAALFCGSDAALRWTSISTPAGPC
jgi:transcription-repair coupling factor (superfamily II helicase)